MQAANDSSIQHSDKKQEQGTSSYFLWSVTAGLTNGYAEWFIMYLEGNDVAQDYKMAFEWFNKATNNTGLQHYKTPAAPHFL